MTAIAAPGQDVTTRVRAGGRAWRPARVALGAVTILTYVFLYLPLIVVVLYSFSATKVNAWPIQGYSLKWYRELQDDSEIRAAIGLSIRLGLTAALIAMVLGTLGALALDRYRIPGKTAIRFLVVLPITLPGIVTGVALLSFFSLSNRPLADWTTTVAGLSFPWPLIIGHATFCITLVMNNVVARLGQLPRQLDEASADLGATPWRTFWRVTFPLILPAILAGGILAFTLSFDEIVVSLFLKGRDNTLPLLIWGRLRLGLSPEINAAATVIIGVSLIGVLVSSRLLYRSAPRAS
ncbi:MAG: ABC transporter permease [Thermomicrobiales bacterium]|nr:MAG: ABC transporter permease [Thermomicrobiales bacterium]